MNHNELTEKIIGCAMKVHNQLGPGFLESVYEKALTHELQKHNLQVECQVPLKVYYDDIVVGEFYADMYIQDSILVENKAVQSITRHHHVQLVNYLTATNVEVGLLINFGSKSLEFKRKHRLYNTISKSK